MWVEVVEAGSLLAAAICARGWLTASRRLAETARSRRGLLPFATPGKDHSAHRLANLGLGQRGAVLAIYLVGAISGGTAILATYLSNRAAAFAGLTVVLAMLLAVAWLERAPYEKQERKVNA